MLTGFLLRRLERAQTPNGVRLAARALELATGYRTADLLEAKDVIAENSFTYQDGTQYNAAGLPQNYNGFYRLQRLVGGNRSYSGNAVTFDSALEVPALYGGVKIIAEDMGTLPNFTYRRGPDRTTTKDYEHPLYQVLHDLPNPEIGAGEFCEMLTAHALLCGNGYALIERVGRRIYLWPWMPDEVRVERNQRGASFYIHREGGGSEKTYTRDRIFHLRSLMLGGVYGDNLLLRARHAIGLGQAGQEYAARFFANDATPGIILKRPIGAPPLTPANIEIVKEAWIKRFRRNPHEPAILQDGTEPMRLDPDHQKLQMLESRKYQVIEACRYLRLSPYKLADHDRATFCLPGSAEVLTLEGPKRIDQIQVSEEVWTHDGERWTIGKVLRSACAGHDEILTLKSTNRTLRLNAKHCVFARISSLVGAAAGQKIRPGQHPVTWQSQWIPAGELSIGDTIIALGRLPAGGNDEIPSGREPTIGFLEFCGLLLGDGNIAMSNGDATGVQMARGAEASYMDAYREIMRREFRAWAGGGKGQGRTRIERPILLQECERQTRFQSRLAATELQMLGFSGTARTKRVPGWVFKMSEPYRLALIRGFLDADGSVDKLGRISFSSCNPEMLSQIRYLCMGVGVPVTNQRLQIGQTKLPNGRIVEYRQYCFSCSDPGANKRIGSHTPLYVERMTRGKAFSRKARRYPWYGGRGFDISGCELTRIRSIQRSVEIEPVYDLEVEGNHNFVADGVLVHNSNIEELGREHVSQTIGPWVRRWRQASYRCLLTEDERLADSLYTEHSVEAFLQGRFDQQSEGYRKLLEKGVFSINEVRRLMNLNPVPGGDEHFIQLNMATVQDVATGATLPDSGPSTKLLPVSGVE